MLLTIRKSPKVLYPLQKNCNFCNRNHCNHHCNPLDTFLRRVGNHHIFSTFIRKLLQV